MVRATATGDAMGAVSGTFSRRKASQAPSPRSLEHVVSCRSALGRREVVPAHSVPGTPGVALYTRALRGRPGPAPVCARGPRPRRVNPSAGHLERVSSRASRKVPTGMEARNSQGTASLNQGTFRLRGLGGRSAHGVMWRAAPSTATDTGRVSYWYLVWIDSGNDRR